MAKLPSVISFPLFFSSFPFFFISSLLSLPSFTQRFLTYQYFFSYSLFFFSCHSSLPFILRFLPLASFTSHFLITRRCFLSSYSFFFFFLSPIIHLSLFQFSFLRISSRPYFLFSLSSRLFSIRVFRLLPYLTSLFSFFPYPCSLSWLSPISRICLHKSDPPFPFPPFHIVSFFLLTQKSPHTSLAYLPSSPFSISFGVPCIFCLTFPLSLLYPFASPRPSRVHMSHETRELTCIGTRIARRTYIGKSEKKRTPTHPFDANIVRVLIA